jgi:hypothetical protein
MADQTYLVAAIKHIAKEETRHLATSYFKDECVAPVPAGHISNISLLQVRARLSVSNS